MYLENSDGSRKLLLVLVICTVSTGIADGKKVIPPYLHICKKSDPNLGECIKNSVEYLKPMLAAGIPELSIPPIEPLYIPELRAIEGKGINVITKDLYVKGASEFQIESIDADIDNGVFKCRLLYSQLSITGQYIVNGSLLMLPIRGDGDVIGEVKNSDATVTMTSTFTVDNGEKHLHWSDMDISINVEKGKVHLTNLFGGEKLLGDVVNAAINVNFAHFFKELKPLIEKVLSQFLLETADKITQGYDYNEIFPE